MKTKIHSTQSYGCLSVVIIFLALTPATLWGQAVSNPNQIAFSNTNPDILAILNAPTDFPPDWIRHFCGGACLPTALVFRQSFIIRPAGPSARIESARPIRSPWNRLPHRMESDTKSLRIQ